VEDFRVEVVIPEITQGDDDKETQIISFVLELSQPGPEGVKLSKQNVCVIEIVPDDILGEER